MKKYNFIQDLNQDVTFATYERLLNNEMRSNTEVEGFHGIDVFQFWQDGVSPADAIEIIMEQIED